VVKVCAGKELAVVARNTRIMQTVFDKLSFSMLTPFRLRAGAKVNNPAIANRDEEIAGSIRGDTFGSSTTPKSSGRPSPENH